MGLELLLHAVSIPVLRVCVGHVRARPQVRASFRPEFVNRVDEFVVFEGLRLEQIRQIVRLQAKRVEQRLEDQKIHLQLTDDAVDYLAVRAPCLLLAFPLSLRHSCSVAVFQRVAP